MSPNENWDESPRSTGDFVHFSITSLGFFVVAGGVVLSSAPTVLWGLALMGWGLAWFFLSED